MTRSVLLTVIRGALIGLLVALLMPDRPWWHRILVIAVLVAILTVTQLMVDA